jgi:type IV pilus assembly protein PilO
MRIPQLAEFLRGKDRREKVIILGSALVFICYILFLLPPQIMGLSNLSKNIKALKADVKATQDDIEKVASYRSRLEDGKARYQTYQALVLTHEQEIPNLLEMISAMAKESGVKIVGIRPLRSKETFTGIGDAMYKEIPIQVSAKAGYHELGVFLSRAEKAKKIINLKNITIESSRSSVKKHEVELLFSAYLLTGEG